MHSAIISFGFIIVYVNVFNLFLLEAQSIQQDQGVVFKYMLGKKLLLKLTFSSLKLQSYSSDRTVCVSYCLTFLSCKCANFRISTGECSLFGVNSWEIEFTVISDIDNIIIQKITDRVVTHGNWTLIFRGQANIGKSVYDAYTNTSQSHDQPLSPMYPIGCLRLDTNLSCDHHFRSNLLNNWSNLTINEVKFSIYKDGFLQKFLLFNGSKSTVMNWFSTATLLNSSWTDLPNSPIVFFDVWGCVTPEVTRHFYIESSHPGCNIDNGWFACIDQLGDACSWGVPTPSFPRFLYSPANTRVANINMMTADIIAIFIKNF